jgi:hypothetical protein
VPEEGGREGRAVILFLDFDGVLHPNNRAGRLFMWGTRLAAWLDTWPGVDVVISSSWREVHPKDEIVEMLGPAIASRVVGCTPWARQKRDDGVYPAATTTQFKYERQAQIAAWMASSWDPARAWVALDDMPYLFERDCAHLIVCAGRTGLSRENLQALSGPAQRAGLVRSSNRGLAPVRADSTAPADRMLTVEKYLKHWGSFLPDALLRVTVDRDLFLVTVSSTAFDSHLLGWLVTRILPEEHGIKAYRDDNAGWTPSPAPYDLRVRIGGEAHVELEAQVVRLSNAVGGGVSVRLS